MGPTGALLEPQNQPLKGYVPSNKQTQMGSSRASWFLSALFVLNMPNPFQKQG